MRTNPPSFRFTGHFKLLLLSGLIAQGAFEFYAWVVSPVVFGVTLEPAKLIMGLHAKYLGVDLPYAAAFAMHIGTGVVGISGVTLLLYRLFGSRAVLSGVAGGLLLWFVAQGVLAPAMGRAFMMGFGAYTQSSFVAHVGFSLIVTLFVSWRLRCGALRSRA
tara:strand:- start:8123 stop:8605 length:483 start_codon:yes stop_codon:yes gene_type:complete